MRRTRAPVRRTNAKTPYIRGFTDKSSPNQNIQNISHKKVQYRKNYIKIEKENS